MARRARRGRTTSTLNEGVRRELLRAAAEHRTVTYGFLMKKFRLSRGASGGKGVVGVIGEVDRREAKKGAPRFRGDSGPQGHRLSRRGVLLLGRRPAGLEEAEERGFEPQAVKWGEEACQKVAGGDISLLPGAALLRLSGLVAPLAGRFIVGT
jgi:hypothetical protein